MVVYQYPIEVLKIREIRAVDYVLSVVDYVLSVNMELSNNSLGFQNLGGRCL